MTAGTKPKTWKQRWTQVKIWRNEWGELTGKLLAIAGSWASLVALIFPFLPLPKDWPWWVTALLIFAVLCLVVLVILECVTHRGRRVFAIDDTEGIKSYMHSWISHGGRVAIWTRDMTWATNDDTLGLLTDKAARKELIICLPESNALSNQLSAAGAEVCPYGAELLESPTSRFTIAAFGRDGSRVAVGRGVGDMHVISEFDAGSHPAYYLAADLIALARAHSSKGQAV